MILKGTHKGESSFLVQTDTEWRKRGEQTGLDTLVVHALNDECSTWGLSSVF